MKGAFTVRRTREEDLPRIGEIEARCFSEPWSLRGFKEALQEKETAALFTAEGGEDGDGPSVPMILGYLVFYHAGDEGELMTTAVDPSFRGQGVGGTLMDAMIAFAVGAGIKKIALEVRVSNQAAIRLYESRGFTRAGIRRSFYRFPEENAYTMTLSEDQMREEKNA